MGPLFIFGLLVFHRSTEIEICLGSILVDPLRVQQHEQHRTKNEDNDNYPQGKNPGNRVFFDSKLDTKELRNS